MMTDDIVRQLIAFGAPDDVIAAARAKVEVAPVDPDYYVWPENWTAVQVFLNLSTQWRVLGGMSGIAWLGLDYGLVEPQLRRLGIPRAEWPAHWDALSLMELAALPLLNKKSN